MLVKKEEYRVDLWLPDDPEKKIKATLFIEEDGSLRIPLIIEHGKDELKLFGSNDKVIPVLFAYQAMGFNFRLESVYCQFHTSYHDRTELTLMPARCILSSPKMYDGQRLTEINIHMDGFNKLIDHSGIVRDDSVFGRKKCVPVGAINLKSLNEIKPSIEYMYSEGFNRHEISIKEEAYLHLEVGAGKSVQEWREIVRKINLFMNMIFGKPQAITEVRSRFGPEVERGTLNLYFRTLPLQGVKLRGQMFLFSDYEENFGLLLTAFIEIYDEIVSSLSLFYSSFFSENEIYSTRFLFIAVALESFDRFYNGNDSVLPDDEWAELKNSLEKVLTTPKQREILLPKLQYMNEFSFRMRLRRMLEQIAPILPDNFDRKLFISSFVDLRNRQVHQNDIKSDADVQEQIAITSQAQAIYILIVLNSCFEMAGLSPAKLKNPPHCEWFSLLWHRPQFISYES